VVGGLTGFALLVIVIYLLGPVWQDFGEYVMVSGILLLASGLLADRAIPRKRRFHRVLHLTTAIFAVGAGLAFGSFAFIVDKPLYGLILDAVILSMFLLFTSLMIWANKSQERMKILVDGDYSLELVRELTGRVAQVLASNGLASKKDGNSFQLDLDGKERINFGIRADYRYEDIEYVLILRTNRSRDSPVYASLKEHVSRIVEEIEEDKGFDTFTKVKSVVCGKCDRKVSYIIATDQFFCSKCRKYKKDQDVRVIGA
jgi:hypothetical protein